MSDRIEDIACDTARDLLEKLHPFHALWSGAANTWIYRGQEADLPLVASAHRNPSPYPQFGVDQPTTQPHLGPQRSRWATERRLIELFLREVNGSGLELPEQGVKFIGAEQCKPADLALAQHYGVPTSLLDWSELAHKAAYFAASAMIAAKTPPEQLVGDCLVVWALRRDTCHQSPIGDRIEIVHDIPTSSNPNIRAQSGLFTQLFADDIVPIETFIIDPIRLRPHIPLPWMRKFKVPRSSAKDMLRLIDQLGINGASMFPGHQGAVLALRERAACRA